MTAIIVEFTTEVVQQAIVSHEQKKYMKGDIKVYGLNRGEVIDHMSIHAIINTEGFFFLIDYDRRYKPRFGNDGNERADKGQIFRAAFGRG